MRKNEKGITLIALIITIIVMLILVAVTVIMVNNGGIFGRADEASRKTEKEAIYDQIVGAMEITDDGKINVESTFEKVKNIFGVGNVTEISKTETEITFEVTGKRGTYKYKITGSGIEKDPVVVPDIESFEGWIYLEEDEESSLFYRGTESVVSLTEIIPNVPKFAEEIVGYDDHNDPIKEIKFKGYADFDLTQSNLYITFFGNESIQQVNLNGYPINLLSECFCGCTNLTSVTFEAGDNTCGITEIPGYAFEGCSSLTTIEIPNSITSIADSAFIGCTNLTQIVVDKESDSISGAPWGAPSASVTWLR